MDDAINTSLLTVHSAATSSDEGYKPHDEEIIKECPLCKSDVKFFFVNYNEKVAMCENQDCEFPFGYEELNFVKQDDDWEIDDELDTISSCKTKHTDTGSMISTAAWSDIDKLNRAYDSEDSHQEMRNTECTKKRDAKIKEFLEEKEVENETMKHVQEIRKLNSQLQSYEEEANSCIRNEKWIKHLMSLQGLSGVQLLKKEEMVRLKKEEAYLGPNELTIDIDRSQNMSIKIEFSNRSNVDNT